jgi:hypothetical protein
MKNLVEEMADIFIDNRDEDGNIGPEVFEELGSMFEEVDPEFRAAVFLEFLSELDERGVVYDVEQFVGDINEETVH